MKEKYKNVIIAPGKGMGNFISMMSCFQTIAKKNNQKIIILTKASTSAKMYINNQSFCNEVIYFEENKRGIFNVFYNLKIFLKLVFFLKNYKIENLYVLHPSKKYVLSALFAKVKNIYAPGYRFQNCLLPKKNKYYKSFFSKALDPLIESQELVKKIFDISHLEKGLLVNRINYQKKYIGICISCSGYERQWGIENYFKVISYLISKGYKKFIILSGKDQEKLENKIISNIKKNFNHIEIVKTSKKKINFIYEKLKEVFLYIGNDTGIMHLSLALGIRSVVIHGDCPPQHYSPMIYAVDNKNKIRSKTAIKKINFAQVKIEIDKALKLERWPSG